MALRGWVRRTPQEYWWSLAPLILLSLLFSWPTIHHGFATVINTPQGDSSLYLWTNAWVAHAISHGTNPFFSPALFAPQGINLLANPVNVGLAILFTPLTWLAGPVATLNAQILLIPIINGLAMVYGLRGWLRSRSVIVVLGVAWAFTPFVVSALGQDWTHVALTAYLPIAARLSHEILTQARWRSAVALGVVSVLQLFFGTEILAMSVIVIAMAVGSCLVVGVGRPATRMVISRNFRRTLRVVAAGSAVAGVLAAWPLWYMLQGPQHFGKYVWPAWVSRAGGVPWSHFVATATNTVQFDPLVGPLRLPNAASLGWVLLGMALVAIAVVPHALRWAFALCVVVGLNVAHGPSGPFSLMKLFLHVPLLRNVVAERFELVVWWACLILLGLLVEELATMKLSPSARRVLTVSVLSSALLWPVVVDVSAGWYAPRAPVERSAEGQIRLGSHSRLVSFPLPASATAIEQQLRDNFRYSLTFGYGPTYRLGGPSRQRATELLSGLSSAVVTAHAPVPRELVEIAHFFTQARVTDVLLPRASCVGWRCYEGNALPLAATMTLIYGAPRVLADSWHWHITTRVPSQVALTRSQWYQCNFAFHRYQIIALPSCVRSAQLLNQPS